MADRSSRSRGVSKSFTIPSVRRETVREHALDFFRPRAAANGCACSTRQLRAATRREPRAHGPQRLRQEHAAEDRVRHLPRRHRARRRARAVTPILELGVGWNPELDAIDNIELLGTVMGLSLRELRARDRDEILAFAELERFANLELRHYSSGMAARLAYAVAFRAVREVLILDEIFAVGDAGFKERCEARYRELHAPATRCCS